MCQCIFITLWSVCVFLHFQLFPNLTTYLAWSLMDSFPTSMGASSCSEQVSDLQKNSSWKELLTCDFMESQKHSQKCLLFSCSSKSRFFGRWKKQQPREIFIKHFFLLKNEQYLLSLSSLSDCWNWLYLFCYLYIIFWLLLKLYD